MIKVFSNRLARPMFKIAETIIHRYPNYSQHVVKEKIIHRYDNIKMHRFYLYDESGHHKEFICDMITDEVGIFPRAQKDTIHICDKRGHEYFVYEIRRNK